MNFASSLSLRVDRIAFTAIEREGFLSSVWVYQASCIMQSHGARVKQPIDFERFAANYQTDSDDCDTSALPQSENDRSQLSSLRTAYLSKVLQGTHIIGRDFAYMTSMQSACGRKLVPESPDGAQAWLNAKHIQAQFTTGSVSSSYHEGLCSCVTPLALCRLEICRVSCK